MVRQGQAGHQQRFAQVVGIHHSHAITVVSQVHQAIEHFQAKYRLGQTQLREADRPLPQTDVIDFQAGGHQEAVTGGRLCTGFHPNKQAITDNLRRTNLHRRVVRQQNAQALRQGVRQRTYFDFTGSGATRNAQEHVVDIRINHTRQHKAKGALGFHVVVQVNADVARFFDNRATAGVDLGVAMARAQHHFGPWHQYILSGSDGDFGAAFLARRIRADAVLDLLKRLLGADHQGPQVIAAQAAIIQAQVPLARA